MKKPIYYLHKPKEQSNQDFNRQKDFLVSIGFFVVVLQEGGQQKEIQDGIKLLLQNHYPYMEANSSDTERSRL